MVCDPSFQDSDLECAGDQLSFLGFYFCQQDFNEKWGYVIIPFKWSWGIQGSLVNFGKLFIMHMDEMGCNQFIAFYSSEDFSMKVFSTSSFNPSIVA